MYKIEMSSKFRRELKIARKRGYDMDKLDVLWNYCQKVSRYL